jgi:hypothetical protein
MDAGANRINPWHPESKKFLANLIKGARDNGVGYIKIDYNGIGSNFVDPTQTRLQAFRELYTVYRNAAGEDTYNPVLPWPAQSWSDRIYRRCAGGAGFAPSALRKMSAIRPALPNLRQGLVP